MKRAPIALIIGFLLVACSGSDSSGRPRRPRRQATTTTAAPARLEWATPDGYRYGFRVADRRIDAVANPGFVTAVATIEITNLLDRRDDRVNLPQATDRRLMLAIRQERFGGVCPSDFNDPYDYKLYVAASGYCVITSSAITSDYGLPEGPNESATVLLTIQVATSLNVQADDLGVFFFDPLLSLTPVLEVLPAGATYGVSRSPDCGNPVSGELRPECEAAFHADLLVPVP